MPELFNAADEEDFSRFVMRWDINNDSERLGILHSSHPIALEYHSDR
jgi:hypothetical protein